MEEVMAIVSEENDPYDPNRRFHAASSLQSPYFVIRSGGDRIG